MNVEFLRKDRPLNNSAIMVKWKCLKFLYSSKRMCRIDSQLKKLICLKYLILETPYTFFSIFSWYFSFTHTQMFSDVNSINFSIFGFSNFSFFVFVFTTLKKRIFILVLIWHFSKSKHFNITVSVLWLPNQLRKHSRFKQ